MSILLDTGVWFAKLHKRDRHHDEAQALIAACMDNAHGPVHTTTDVIDEAFTLIQSRGGTDAKWMLRDLSGLLGFSDEQPTIASVFEIDSALQQNEAWPLFRRHCEDRGLSLTDCTSLVTIRRHGIDKIGSFDSGFDGLVARVDE